MSQQATISGVPAPPSDASSGHSGGGGGILYVDAGMLKWRGQNGTVTTLAAA